MYTPPTNKKPVQLVKNFDKVPEKKRKWPMIGQVKIDGCFAYGLCVPGDNRIFSRTGEEVKSLRHIEEELAKLSYMNCVLIFEVYRNGWPVNKISGAFRRQSEQFTEAVAYVHDCIPYEDFVKGVCSIPYRERTRRVQFLSNATFLKRVYGIPIVNQEHAYEYAEGLIREGSEGLVLKDPNGTWKAGARNEMMTKIKQELSYDLLVIGMEEGRGKYENTLGKLVCRWTDDRVVKVSGMTDAQRERWWNAPETIEGCIVKVDAMCLTPDGMLREPRFKEVRSDKVEADV